MGIILGLVIAFSCMLGGFAAMGGHLEVLIQPWEFVIILGLAVGAYIVANPVWLVKDTGNAVLEAFKQDLPKQKDYLAVLGILYALMREMRSKPRAEIEDHFDNPQNSEIFKRYPSILADDSVSHFICDYCRLIVIGTARPFEIEALMDEEIRTISHDTLKSASSVQSIADALPALGIIAAVLGIIKTMASINEKPEILGHLIGSALVGTFAGIFFCYGIFGPIANQIQVIRRKKVRIYVIIKQTLIAYMNGAIPQIALEYGRKTISVKERPSIAVVEQEALSQPNATKPA